MRAAGHGNTARDGVVFQMLVAVCGVSHTETDTLCVRIVRCCRNQSLHWNAIPFYDIETLLSDFRPEKYTAAYLAIGGAEGFLAARRLREQDRRCRIAIIDDTDQYALMAYRIHASDYMIRPVSDVRLNHSVEMVLGRL